MCPSELSIEVFEFSLCFYLFIFLKSSCQDSLIKYQMWVYFIHLLTDYAFNSDEAILGFPFVV